MSFSDGKENRHRGGEAPKALRAWFDRALAEPPERRDFIIAELKLLDPVVGEQLRQMLTPTASAAGEAALAALDGAMLPLGAHGSGESSAPTRVGTAIGPYVLRERLGEGGFGEVWLGERLEPMRQEVAVKIIKPGMDSRAVVARFDHERQTLARMDHPNISRIFDAGTTPDGRPYFVMELVRGTPITSFCDQAQSTISERLELMRV
ncbi:MAG: protein kinase, partial [Phycisphaerales bacterium]